MLGSERALHRLGSPRRPLVRARAWQRARSFRFKSIDDALALRSERALHSLGSPRQPLVRARAWQRARSFRFKSIDDALALRSERALAPLGLVQKMFGGSKKFEISTNTCFLAAIYYTDHVLAIQTMAKESPHTSTQTVPMPSRREC